MKRRYPLKAKGDKYSMYNIRYLTVKLGEILGGESFTVVHFYDYNEESKRHLIRQSVEDKEQFYWGTYEEILNALCYENDKNNPINAFYNESKK